MSGRIERWKLRVRRILLGLLAFAVLGEIATRIWDGAHGGTGSLYDYVAPAGSRFKMLSPDETQLFSGRFDLINRRIAAFCRREGIDLLDPLRIYRASPERLDLYYDGVHYSPRGHALARLVAAELRRLRLVRPEGA